MTQNSRFKKEVRARMVTDDVTYTEARRRILAEREKATELADLGLAEILAGEAIRLEPGSAVIPDRRQESR